MDAEQFGDIVLRAQPDASLLRIRDVGTHRAGRVDLFRLQPRSTGKPSCIVIVFLSPGANAVETANQVNAFMTQAKKDFPAGVDYVATYDSTRFVRAAIQDVVETLFVAIGLVILVVFLFLQNWRATLIPLLTVPVAVMGTFALFPLLGFSINITSMFGLVLAIGIVVDDAIVVVEAVQRNIDDGMTPREATLQAMAAGVRAGGRDRMHSGSGLYSRGFPGRNQRPDLPAIRADHRSSVLISAFSALSLSPALSALLLRPQAKSRGPLAFCLRLVQSAPLTGPPIGIWRASELLIRRFGFPLVALARLLGRGRVAVQNSCPAGFLPDEDQGIFFTAGAAAGWSVARAHRRGVDKVETRLRKTPGVEDH